MQRKIRRVAQKRKIESYEVSFGKLLNKIAEIHN